MHMPAIPLTLLCRPDPYLLEMSFFQDPCDAGDSLISCMCKKFPMRDVIFPKAGHIYPVRSAERRSQSLQLHGICKKPIWITRAINLHYLVLWRKAKATFLSKHECVNKDLEKFANLRCRRIRKPPTPPNAGTCSLPVTLQSLAPLSLE